MTNKEFLQKLEEKGFTPLGYYEGFSKLEFQLSDKTLELEKKDSELYEIYLKNDTEESRDQWYKKHSEFNISKKQDRENYFDLGDYEEVEQFGGEGQGDNYYVVLYFKEHNIYVRADAWYASYHGVDDWEDWYVVKPEEQTIIVYNAVEVD